MSTSSAQLLVLAEENFACIRIQGRANLTASIDFKTLIDGLREKGCNYFVLDLTQCTLMDSTFLGTLAGFGLTMDGARNNSSQPLIELLNPNPRILELIENLGVLHLFKVTSGAPLQAQAKLQPCPVATTAPEHEQTARLCLQAHRTLMQLNPENVARFKDITRFLEEDLKKTQPH